MPNMVLNRTYVLRSLKGHSVAFEKGKPAWVPPHIVAEAVALGAEMTNGEAKPDIIPPEKPQPNNGPADAALREKQIIEGITLLMSENVREKFTAAGEPTPVAVKDLLGYPVPKSEIHAMCLKRAEMIAAGLLGPNGEYA